MGRIDDEGRRVFRGIRTANNTLIGKEQMLPMNKLRKEMIARRDEARRWNVEHFAHPHFK